MTPDDEEDVYLTPREVAEKMHVSIDTIKRALKAGHLRSQRLGARGDWRIPLSAYREWLASGARIRAPKPEPTD